MTVQTVPTRDKSSGRYHKRYYDTDTGKFASYEGDNLDEAGDFEVTKWVDIEEADPKDKCRNCFPEKQDMQSG